MKRDLSAVLAYCPAGFWRCEVSAAPSREQVSLAQRAGRWFRGPLLGMAAFCVLVLLGCGGQTSDKHSLQEDAGETTVSSREVSVCPSGDACGGHILGTWTGFAVCDISVDQASSEVRSRSFLQVEGGICTFRPDGSFEQSGTLTETKEVTLSADFMADGGFTACEQLDKVLNEAIGTGAFTCADATDGGCTCRRVVETYQSLEGTYTTRAGTLTLSLGPGPGFPMMDYCIKGNELWISAPCKGCPTIPGASRSLLWQLSRSAD